MVASNIHPRLIVKEDEAKAHYFGTGIVMSQNLLIALLFCVWPVLGIIHQQKLQCFQILLFGCAVWRQAFAAPNFPQFKARTGFALGSKSAWLQPKASGVPFSPLATLVGFTGHLLPL